MTGSDLDDLCAELRERHGCHTAVLYGSWARGDAGPDSDCDIAGFGARACVTRDTRSWRGTCLDIFVYPEERLAAADAELLKLRDGRVLFQKEKAATRLLEMVEAFFRAGPASLAPDEAAARRQWAYKMLRRIERGDLEGDYRRAWLLTALLEDYFQLRDRWFAGPKEGLAWLRAHDPRVHAAFSNALAPGASVDAISVLVEAVAGTQMQTPDSF